MLISEDGFIPLRVRNDLLLLPTFGEIFKISNTSIIGLGKLSNKDFKNQTVKITSQLKDSTFSNFSSDLNSSKVKNKLRGVYRMAPIKLRTFPILDESFKLDNLLIESSFTSYCAAFSDDVKKCECPLMKSEIKIRRIGNIRHLTSFSSITMIIAAWSKNFFQSDTEELFNVWDGPKV
jgi:hypothetical protein